MCYTDNSEIQEYLLYMLSWFHNFCTYHNLRYYALGGTMLGAVRHKGFIPWDDDVDVGMPRKDYNRLISLMKSEKNSRYVLESPDSDDVNFCYAFSKLYDTKTTLMENTKMHLNRGIYIDIFPLDAIGATKKEMLRNYKRIKFQRNVLTLRLLEKRKDRPITKKALIAAVQAIPESILSAKKLSVKIDRICDKFQGRGYSWGGNLHGAWGVKELMDFSVMGNGTLYQFESIKIFGADNYDEYLSSLYGNWRQLPPEEKRISHHDYIMLDLHKSYLGNDDTAVIGMSRSI